MIAARLASTCAGSSCCVCHHSFCGFCGAAAGASSATCRDDQAKSSCDHGSSASLLGCASIASMAAMIASSSCVFAMLSQRGRARCTSAALSSSTTLYALDTSCFLTRGLRARYRSDSGTAGGAPRVLLPSALSLSGSITPVCRSVRLAVGQAGARALDVVARASEAAFGTSGRLLASVLQPLAVSRLWQNLCQGQKRPRQPSTHPRRFSGSRCSVAAAAVIPQRCGSDCI